MAEVVQIHEEIMKRFKPLEHFTRVLLDAYVLNRPYRRIIKANQLFSQLSGLSLKQAMKADSLFDTLSFFLEEKEISLQDINGYRQPTRIDEVRGRRGDNFDHNLILGIYPIADDAENRLGSFILIRDVTAETNLQSRYKDAANKSITDPLTGLFTRGYFEDYLRLQTSLTEKGGQPGAMTNMSVVMIDIDHFKKVNDVHGHQAGDHVLKETARVMKKIFRKTDVCCRYGGEEFLVILPNTTGAGAQQAAEKMRTEIAGLTIEFNGKRIPVTMSAGVTEIALGKEQPIKAIARADAALYRAKETGRNQVCMGTSTDSAAA